MSKFTDVYTGAYLLDDKSSYRLQENRVRKHAENIFQRDRQRFFSIKENAEFKLLNSNFYIINHQTAREQVSRTVCCLMLYKYFAGFLIRKPDKKTAFGKKTFSHTYTRCIVVFLVHCVLTITINSFRYVFLAVGTIIALQFSESVFLECERDWFVKQSNERIPKKRWKFTYERSPVLTHRCMFTSFRIVFL